MELENVKNSYSGPWLLGGDFNDTASMEERTGIGGSEMQRNVIAKAMLLEVPVIFRMD